MGNVRGGDIRQTLIGGREFEVAADADVKIMLSGFNNENLATGNGNIHTNQKRIVGGFDDLDLSIDDSRKDQEFLQVLSDDAIRVPVTITLASGITYAGALIMEGELSGSKGTGKLSISMRGNRFEQI